MADMHEDDIRVRTCKNIVYLSYYSHILRYFYLYCQLYL